MHFAITLEDGTVVESSFGAAPLRFTAGDGTLVAGVERALYGLRAGDHKRLRLGPADAYGYPDPDNIHTLPRSQFGPEMELGRGSVVAFTTPTGDEVPGIVLAVSGHDVQVDFSHPLAGHELQVEVEVLSVQPAEPAA
jgi:FKBP-type peptidyl-prolyl cis-trans isomerase SlpA